MTFEQLCLEMFNLNTEGQIHEWVMRRQPDFAQLSRAQREDLIHGLRFQRLIVQRSGATKAESDRLTTEYYDNRRAKLGY